MTSPITVSNLTVRYGALAALDDVSFALDAGTSTALVGANGSGKSTLLNVLAGLLPPTSGVVSDVPAAVSYVLQHTAQRAWMPLTVTEVLRMARYEPRHPVRRMRSVDRDAIAAASRRLDVGDLATRQFGELSGGQRQRVLVAQAIAREAPLLLMDEPITGLDMPSQERILHVIEEETAAGHTVVISTHHLEEAHHCDQVLVLANRLVAAGAPTEVLEPEILRAAYDQLVLGAHEGHDHPVGVLWLDDHGHGHDPDARG